MIEMQHGMFGDDVPVWKATPPFGKVIAERLWWLWANGENQIIADDDAEMMIQYWVEFEGLAQALGLDGLRRFHRWFTQHNPTSAETLRRTRQWETSDKTPGGPYIKQSPEVRRKREAKEKAIRASMAVKD